MISQDPEASPTTKLGEDAKCLAKQVNCNWNAARPKVVRTSTIREAAAADISGAGGPSQFLREAAPGEPWFYGAHIGNPEPHEGTTPERLIRISNDPSSPTDPGNLRAQAIGLFQVAGSWDASTDPESNISSYAYAIGTGTTSATEADIRWWQSVGNSTSFGANLVLTEGMNIFVSVYAINGANMPSAKVRSGPIRVAPTQFGKAGNTVTYTLSSIGYDANGSVIGGWNAADSAKLRRFLDLMLPVIHDLYGPPATSINVKLVRDLKHRDNAIYSQYNDEIRGGDTMTLQLLTHEFVHAWRNRRLLSSGPTWDFDTTISAFEEAFAHSAAYEAMTEFARRYPDYGLTQQLYQSTTEWDYDFQNVSQLRTQDFWSNFGGTQLHWIRYEMGASGIQKILTEYPGLYRKFNAEFYSRINANPRLTMSREEIIRIFEKVTPTVEGMAVRDWINQQNIFATQIESGIKIWSYVQHYPQRPGEYFIFDKISAYETFPNGSDWAWYPDGVTASYHRLNGSRGFSRITKPNGEVVTITHLISPTQNPPEFMGYGSSDLNLTSQSSNQPWPGGDPSHFALDLKQLGLYRIDTTIFAGEQPVSTTRYEVMGGDMRDAYGAWGGIIGATGGTVTLRHNASPLVVTAPLVNGAFYIRSPWISQVNTPTNSIDSIPGMIEVEYRDPAGSIYRAKRSIMYGSWYGNQAFLFQLAPNDLLRPTLGKLTQPPVPVVTPPIGPRIQNNYYFPVISNTR